MYGDAISNSILLEDLFTKLKSRVLEEIQVEKQLSEVLGMLEMVFSASIRA